MTPAKMEGTSGENIQTIMLPFDVESVCTVSGRPLTMSGTQPDIWLYEFAGEDGDELFFERVEKLQANRPYLVEFVNLDYEQVCFASGDETIIQSSDQRIAQSGFSYRFSPVASFHPAITDVSGKEVTGWTAQLSEGPTNQGIVSADYNSTMNLSDIYDLMGRKMPQFRKSGCYVVGGKLSVISGRK